MHFKAAADCFSNVPAEMYIVFIERVLQLNVLRIMEGKELFFFLITGFKRLRRERRPENLHRVAPLNE